LCDLNDRDCNIKIMISTKNVLNTASQRYKTFSLALGFSLEIMSVENWTVHLKSAFSGQKFKMRESVDI
jgi:hypothetical protein